ncbi:MAG: hypothetical protein ACRDHX_01580 [Chloroflexota bacterium]
MKMTTETFRWLELPGSEEERVTPEESQGNGFLSVYRRMASVLVPTVSFELDDVEQDEAQRLAV